MFINFLQNCCILLQTEKNKLPLQQNNKADQIKSSLFGVSDL